MLHCPHDMTHWNEEDSMETDSAPISNQSALFSKKDAKGLVTSNPIISIFGYSVNKMTAGLKKVEVIKASFVSPFEKVTNRLKITDLSRYLPNKVIITYFLTSVHATGPVC
ncbi:uncharacterized protein LOC102803057 [Saccoglossus kowalevskii]|uniref:Uncharacterized protein LOC102803057 n=1 Tax=Saccoglossus kowalevskii TaxID=10224 RepID=A0ABM0M9F4_SACKO|nr:PREDICTED: uncharacterized protein LOC102803057 [Saccoglossus kowalevskii]